MSHSIWVREGLENEEQTMTKWEDQGATCRECGHPRSYHGVATDDGTRYCSHLATGRETGQRLPQASQGTPCRCPGFHPT